MRPPQITCYAYKLEVICHAVQLAYGQAQKWNMHNYTKEKSVWKILFLSRVIARSDFRDVCVSIIPC